MKYIRQYSFLILSSLIICALLFWGFHSISQGNLDNQKESLENALKRGIMQCYALEGSYPESLDHLINDYHIIYNEELFDIKYEAVASNIMPSVTVIVKD